MICQLNCHRIDTNSLSSLCSIVKESHCRIIFNLYCNIKSVIFNQIFFFCLYALLNFISDRDLPKESKFTSNFNDLSYFRIDSIIIVRGTLSYHNCIHLAHLCTEFLHHIFLQQANRYGPYTQTNSALYRFLESILGFVMDFYVASTVQHISPQFCLEPQTQINTTNI